MSVCDVCSKNQSVGVGSSTCGPISFAYCKECLNLGAEPYGALVAYLSMAVNQGADCSPEANELHEGYQSTINATLQVAGKTREEFYSDVDVAIKEFDDHMNGVPEPITMPENCHYVSSTSCLRASEVLPESPCEDCALFPNTPVHDLRAMNGIKTNEE